MQMEEEEKKCVYVHCATYNGPSAADLYVKRAMKTRVSNFTLAKEGDGTLKEGLLSTIVFCHFDFFRIKWRTMPTYHDEDADDGRYANRDGWLDSAINVPPRHLQLEALVPCLVTGRGP